ncbi:MAG TPA: WG repeat-containing protein [Saprospiraceae bacterium]|nr:WG repeat-containing protein [Saprospiraceae bacterium]
MLLKINWPSGYLLIIISLCISGLVSCRHDRPPESEEEAAYMADYEAPANKWGFISKEGKMTVKPVYDGVGMFSEGLAAVNKNGLWGFINQDGEIVVTPTYKSVWAFHERKARVHPFDQPGQFIDKEGKTLKGDGWSAADDFSDGRARVKVGDSFGYIDTAGMIVIQAIYTRGWNFKNGICIVEYEDKLGVIDLKGTYILQPGFDFIKISGKQKIILCKRDNISTAYDLAGKEVVAIPECKMVDSDGHLISVRQKDIMYLFDLEKKARVPYTEYLNIIYLEHSLWGGKTKDGYILLNETGQPLSSNAYSQINKFSDGHAAFSKGEFWGYMDEKGTEKTSDVFGLAWDYKEGLARAAFKDGIGFIDLQQKLAFYPPEGSIDLRDFSEGMAAVQFQ